MANEFASMVARGCSNCFDQDKCARWQCTHATYRLQELLRNGDVEQARRVFGDSVFIGEYREPWELPLEPKKK